MGSPVRAGYEIQRVNFSPARSMFYDGAILCPTCAEVRSDELPSQFVFRLQLQQGLLGVVARVLGQDLQQQEAHSRSQRQHAHDALHSDNSRGYVNLGDDEKSIGKRLDPQLGAAFYVGLVFYQSVRHGHLDGSSARHDTP